MKKLILIWSLFAVACATTQPGREASRLEGNSLPVKVFAEQVVEYSDEYNSVISMTFKNDGARWLHVDEIGLEFPANLEQNVIVGNDLRAWAESYRIRKQVENFNDTLGVATAILGGALIAATGTKSKNPGLATAGAAVAVGGVAYDQVNVFRSSKRNVQVAEMVPEGHIYGAFSIPPKGYARRWFLLNTPNKLIAKRFSMNVRTVELGDGAYDVPLRE